MADNEQWQLDRVRGPAKEPRWARASRGVRRTAGRLVGLVGDTAKAAWGDKANDLQRNLHEVGESIRGAVPVDEIPYLVQYDPRWLGFQERVAVVRELAGLIPRL